MTRACVNDGNGWNFIKLGNNYFYREDSLVAEVAILQDLTTQEMYRFRVKVLRSNIPMDENLEFNVYYTRSQVGFYIGQAEFYENKQELGLFKSALLVYDYTIPITQVREELTEKIIALNTEIPETVIKDFTRILENSKCRQFLVEVKYEKPQRVIKVLTKYNGVVYSSPNTVGEKE